MNHFTLFSFDSQGGGSLGVLPLGDVGRMEQSLPLLHAHSGGLSIKQTGAFNLFFSGISISILRHTLTSYLAQYWLCTIHNFNFKVKKIFFYIKNIKNLKRLSYPFTCTFKV